MRYRECEICGRLEDTRHKCQPLFYVWSEENGDESTARKIYALNQKDAAEKWAERYDADSAEYLIVSGNDEIVCVRPEGQPGVFKLRVSGASVPEYRAEYVKLSEMRA